MSREQLQRALRRRPLVFFVDTRDLAWHLGGAFPMTVAVPFQVRRQLSEDGGAVTSREGEAVLAALEANDPAFGAQLDALSVEDALALLETRFEDYARDLVYHPASVDARVSGHAAVDWLRRRRVTA